MMFSMKVLIEPIELHTDQRGFVFEPLLAGQLRGQQNCHVVVTQPGSVRGNHYHRVGTEVLAVVGAWLIRYREDETIKELCLAEAAAVRMTLPPGVAHAFQYLGSGAGLLVAYSDLARDQALADVIRDVLIEP